MSRMLFVNLPVEDLPRTMAFWKHLGFAFNPQFTDEKAAGMIIGADAFAMLLVRPFFETFTKREICDTKTHAEALFALSCESRAGVDALVDAAKEAGGGEPTPPKDHGFMYQRCFTDLDGHQWEAIWMDPTQIQ